MCFKIRNKDSKGNWKFCYSKTEKVPICYINGVPFDEATYSKLSKENNDGDE